MVYREEICDICKQRGDRAEGKVIDDAFESVGGFTSYGWICEACTNRYQHILDQGTDEMADFIGVITNYRERKK